MTRNGRMQKVMMRVLSVMLMASFVLAVMSFVWPAPAVHAEHYCYWKCHGGPNYTACYWCCDAYHCWNTGNCEDYHDSCYY
jgi:hypothetical protein